MNPGSIPRFATAAVDPFALLVAAALSIGAGILAGILPAIGRRAQHQRPSKTRGHPHRQPGHRGRFALIILEVALSVVLLAGSSLLVRSYIQLQSVNPGFSPPTHRFAQPLDERLSR